MMNENYAAGLWTLAMARTESIFISLPVIIAGIVLVLLILIMITGYVKASPDTAVITKKAEGIDRKSRNQNPLPGA